MAEHTAVVLAGGDPAGPRVRDHLPRGAYVIAADSGLAQAHGLGLTVDLVVGDLDSVDPLALEAAAAAGAEVEQHPTAKDRTDLELALDAARRRGATRAVVVGGHGGRLDHFLANALLLGSPNYEDVAIEAYVGAARLLVVRAGFDGVLEGRPGELCSLLPLGGPARGVRTVGLRFALDGERLDPGSTRGVSNEIVDTRALVTIESGVLLVVQPDLRS